MIILIGHLIDLTQHVIDEKNQCKILKIFNVKRKRMMNNDGVFILKSQFLELQKFQCILFLNFVFDGGQFFN